jgi:predicted RNA-binding protein (virulence factor B family)
MLSLEAWMKINSFVGTYKLESFEIEETSGLKRSWGKDVHGLLIYTSDGHMSVSINKAVENKSDNDSKKIFTLFFFIQELMRLRAMSSPIK